jgi:D-glycero-beta-D-manno-heptose 1-phosphate adenylyltransferase
MDKVNVFDNVYAVKAFVDPLRAIGKKLVTTNGCFDILHKGHVQYLYEAASFGDILIVGVNADATVRELKGPERPLQGELDRTYLIASLKMVDGAFIFHEYIPNDFLEILKPDVHVKGGDYYHELVERETVEKNGGRIEIVSLVKGYSTTNVVKKVKSS